MAALFYWKLSKEGLMTEFVGDLAFKEVNDLSSSDVERDSLRLVSGLEITDTMLGKQLKTF